MYKTGYLNEEINYNEGASTLSIMILSIITFNIITLSILTLSMAIKNAALGIMTLHTQHASLAKHTSYSPMHVPSSKI